ADNERSEQRQARERQRACRGGRRACRYGCSLGRRLERLLRLDVRLRRLGWLRRILRGGGRPVNRYLQRVVDNDLLDGGHGPIGTRGGVAQTAEGREGSEDEDGCGRSERKARPGAA